MQEFNYTSAKSLKEASKAINKNTDKTFLFAGGTDILGMVKDNQIFPSEMVNLKSIKELDQIRIEKGKGITIGSLTKINSIVTNTIIKAKYSVLSEAAQSVASMQIRNIGTVGGNICQRPRCWYFRGEFDCLRKGGDECFAAMAENKYHAIIGGDSCYIVHPSDIAVALIALNAEISIFDGKQEKSIPLKDFFVLPEVDIMSENILKSGEIVTKFFIPEQNISSKYIKVAERGVWDFAMVSVAGVIDKNNNSAKLAFGGVAPIPWIEEEVNKSLSNLSESKIEEAINLAFKNADPLEKNEYKITLAKNLVKKVFLELS